MLSKRRLNFGTMNEKSDHYQKSVCVRYRYIIPVLVFLLFTFGLWFFFGAFNTTLTGYGQCFGENRNLILIPITKIDQIHPGIHVWVGNSRGEVTDAVADCYFDYEDICNLNGASVAEIITSGNHDQIFGEFYVSLPDLPLGIFPYSIVINTETPYEHFFGGDQKQ